MGQIGSSLHTAGKHSYQSIVLSTEVSLVCAGRSSWTAATQEIEVGNYRIYFFLIVKIKDTADRICEVFF